ncbi:alpha-L-arabinofuranosidase C-terminal domain-containing protein [Candidatus Poribacteria bacterium]
MSGDIVVLSEVLFDDTISPMIYGDFIEFLNDLLPGMWAEKIQDRCFEGILQPNHVWPPGANWVYPRWKPFASGQPNFDRWPDSHADTEMVTTIANFALDSKNPFVGQQSARVSVETKDEKPFVAGIIQDGIAVKQKQELKVEVYVRGQGLDDKPLKVLLGKNYGAFFRSYDELEFSGVSEQWQRFSGRLTSEVSDDDASLAIGISDGGTFWLDKVSLMPVDSKFGWRVDVVEAIRAMKPGIIRFGGSSLIFYQWQEGIGPLERRTPFQNHPWGNMEENDVGLHEFLQFCELVEAKPLICLNSNSATLEQIMDEIEYCNGPADSRYGSIRAEMGHPEPFNVKYWQIGNEQAGEEYERVMVDYARAIRDKYPDLVLLASYPSDNILFSLSDEVDYVCPHFYAPYTKERENGIRELIQNIRQKARNRELKLGITEWNHTAGHWGWGRAWLLTLYNALNAARALNMYQRLGDMVKIANRSNMTNSCCSGVVQTNRSDIYFTPCYYIQKAYANMAGDKALKVHTDVDETLDISATQRQGDGEVVLFVVNPSSESQTCRIEFPDLGMSDGLARIWTLSGSSLDSANSFQEKDNVAPEEFVMECSGSVHEQLFPAYSITILRFK